MITGIVDEGEGGRWLLSAGVNVVFVVGFVNEGEVVAVGIPGGGRDCWFGRRTGELWSVVDYSRCY